MSNRNTHPRHNGDGYSKTCAVCNPDGWWYAVRARNRRSKRKRAAQSSHQAS